MARPYKIRHHGSIPERRHDAFLLALLLAIVLNITFVIVQAVIPRVSHLVQSLAPEPAVQEEEEPLPFVLVDPTLFDEVLDEEPPDAESLVAREARQTESMPALPEDKPYVAEGVEELATMLPGAPGPADSGMIDAPDTQAREQEAPESPQEEEQPAEETPPPEPEGTPEPPPVAEPPPEAEPLRPPPAEVIVEEPPPEPPAPEVVPEPEPLRPPPPPSPPAESVEEAPPPPAPEPVPEPEPLPEAEQPAETEIQPEPVPTVEVAALPTAPDGFLEAQQRNLEEALQRARVQRQLQDEERRLEAALQQRRREAQERRMLEEIARQQETEHRARQEYERQMQEYAEQQTPAPPAREGRRQPTFRRIGPGMETGGMPPSRRGGAARQRNTASSVNLLDSDPNMRYLAHKYAAYMKEVAELLQQSLNREVILQPMGYTVGQAKIRFTIAPDGSLGYAETEFPLDMNYVRITSENTLKNAAPFPRPTREMLTDPVFQRMSLMVSLY